LPAGGNAIFCHRSYTIAGGTAASLAADGTLGAQSTAGSGDLITVWAGIGNAIAGGSENPLFPDETAASIGGVFATAQSSNGKTMVASRTTRP
jgi:hypothetical protein